MDNMENVISRLKRCIMVGLMASADKLSIDISKKDWFSGIIETELEAELMNLIDDEIVVLKNSSTNKSKAHEESRINFSEKTEKFCIMFEFTELIEDIERLSINFNKTNDSRLNIISINKIEEAMYAILSVYLLKVHGCASGSTTTVESLYFGMNNTDCDKLQLDWMKSFLEDKTNCIYPKELVNCTPDKYLESLKLTIKRFDDVLYKMSDSQIGLFKKSYDMRKKLISKNSGILNKAKMTSNTVNDIVGGDTTV